MDFTKIRVLVTDGSGKQPLAMIRGLKELGCHVTVLCSTIWDSCYVSNKPDEKILNKDLLERDEGTFRFLISLVSSGNYDVIMPIGERSTNFVTEHEEELKKYVKLACAPRDTYIKAYNKQYTFDKAMSLGVPCPYTRSSGQDVEDYLHKAHFPLIIKPRQGLGSIGFHKFENEKDLRERLADNNFQLDDYVLQEFVDFEHRIGTLIFMDKNGNVCTSYATDVLRWFPLDAGSAVLIKTTKADDVLRQTSNLLKALGWKGFAAACFMIDKKQVNPSCWKSMEEYQQV